MPQTIAAWFKRAVQGSGPRSGKGVHEPGSETRPRARRLRSRASSALASELQSNCSPKAPGGVSSSEIRCADVGKRALEAACFRQDADGRGRDKGLADARTTMNHLLPSSLVPLMLYVCM